MTSAFGDPRSAQRVDGPPAFAVPVTRERLRSELWALLEEEDVSNPLAESLWTRLVQRAEEDLPRPAIPGQRRAEILGPYRGQL